MASALYYVFAVLIFLAVVLFVEGAYLWWNDSKGPEARRIERRLQVMSAGAHEEQESLSIIKQRMLAQSPAMHRLLLNVPRVHELDRLLEQSGVSLSLAQFILSTLVAAAFGVVLGRFAGWPVFAVIALALAAGTFPLLYVLRAKHKRLVRLDLQMPDALELMSRALRAGHAFPSALKMVADEMAPPIATEFGATFDEVNYGIAMKDALLNLATRVPSRDLKYFVIAVLIQRETGGNLAELLDGIAAIIRARHKLMGTIRVLSAEGRLSAWILCLLPVVLIVALRIVNPGFADVLWTDPKGLQLLLIAAGLMLIGIFWTRQIIRIHV